jgi:hypothetical protein
VRQAKLCRYVSSDHFSVDGTLLDARAKPDIDWDDTEGRRAIATTSRPASPGVRDATAAPADLVRCQPRPEATDHRRSLRRRWALTSSQPMPP